MNLPALCEQLEAFVEGRLAREQLREWLRPTIVDPPLSELDDEEAPPSWSPEREREEVFWQLLWLADDSDNVDDTRLRDLATRSLRCIAQCGAGDTTSELIPLITARHRLCPIVAKHRAGIVSRVGLHSVIKKTFWHEHFLREWATAASLDTLEDLCTRLVEDDYLGAAQLLCLPPA